MKRAFSHLSSRDRPSDGPADSVTLDFDARHRRRIVLATDAGEKVLLDLDRAVAMAHGDALVLEGGGWIEVLAADENVVEVSASSQAALLRLAWHLGNRHLPAEITPSAIYIRPDSVIESMLADLGATLALCQRSFQPERGAYGHGKEEEGATGDYQGHHQGHDHAH
ncbi:MAG: urease accessory protein UreE [Alphaproteobacteria bacterium]